MSRIRWDLSSSLGASPSSQATADRVPIERSGNQTLSSSTFTTPGSRGRTGADQHGQARVLRAAKEPGAASEIRAAESTRTSASELGNTRYRQGAGVLLRERTQPRPEGPLTGVTRHSPCLLDQGARFGPFAREGVGLGAQGQEDRVVQKRPV